MTREEAAAFVASETRLTERDFADLLACSPDELDLLIRSYKASGAMPEASSWDVVLRVLKACAEVAGSLLPISGAIGAVYKIVKG